jgi:hypothetical protein
VCWDNPASASGKCGDCVRKHGNCEPVITLLGSSTISWRFANNPLDAEISS